MSTDEIIHSLLSKPIGLLVVILLVLTLPSMSVSVLWALQENREGDREEVVMQKFFEVIDHNTMMRERSVAAFQKCVAELTQLKKMAGEGFEDLEQKIKEGPER